MAVLDMDHVNIRTDHMTETLVFFRDILGMSIAPSPAADDIKRAAWVVDVAGRPIIHVGHVDAYPADAGDDGNPTHGGGAIHHIALKCSDYEGIIARLGASGIDYRKTELPSMRRRQLFLKESNGITLVLNFLAD